MRHFRGILAFIAFFVLASFSATAADLAVLSNGFELRHERREQIGETTRLYLTNAPDSGYIDVPTAQIASIQPDTAPPPPAPELAIPALAEADVKQLISAASDRHQVDADLIASVIRAESGFQTRAVSPKGAQGLMQLMPATATKLGVSDPFQPEGNIDGGTRYLRDLLVRYKGDIVKALAAYNAGPQRVQRYQGVPPYRETHSYVARIVRDFNRKKLAARKTGTSAATSPAPVKQIAEQHSSRSRQSTASR